MFESYFSMPVAIARHRAAPLASERENFLDFLAESGTGCANLRTVACYLLTIVKILRLRELRDVTTDEIERASRRWDTNRKKYSGHKAGSWSAQYFGWMARRWLRHEGRLKRPHVGQAFGHYLGDYVKSMAFERGLAKATIEGRRGRAAIFLNWYGKRHRLFSSISPPYLDAYITQESKNWTLVTRSIEGSNLRDFFRHAESRGWCRAGISACIKSPLLRTDPFVARGPAWSDVVRLIRESSGSSRSDTRARALLMLFGIYGIRRGEAVRLRLDDIDWRARSFTVRRGKRGGLQQLPLRADVAEALRRYIEDARPKSVCPNVFLALTGPHRPISEESVSALIQDRMLKLKIKSPTHGPQSIRHAFATQLLRIGRSYEEISQLLGHRDTKSVAVYAKLDTNRLRDVSEVDLVENL